jgi:hypothetical protein
MTCLPVLKVDECEDLDDFEEIFLSFDDAARSLEMSVDEFRNLMRDGEARIGNFRYLSSQERVHVADIMKYVRHIGNRKI